MKFFLLFLLAILGSTIAFSQRKDSINTQKNSSIIIDTVGKEVMKIDTLARRKFITRQATIRSAIIPGWGQVYNKKILEAAARLRCSRNSCVRLHL